MVVPDHGEEMEESVGGRGIISIRCRTDGELE
jgi:hypothetical protein